MQGSWTMTRGGSKQPWYFVDIYVSRDEPGFPWNIHPVFYLDDNVTPINGDANGTEESPYIVA